MWDESNIYPRIETGYAFTKDMKNKLVKKFNKCNFIEGGAVWKVKHCIPKKLFVQHIPIKGKEKNLLLIVCVMVLL